MVVPSATTMSSQKLRALVVTVPLTQSLYTSPQQLVRTYTWYSVSRSMPVKV